ncbi:MAG: aldolase [Alphaproteobacteria bacterium]|nr:aldolase [Alphaproteobacteria bacterium]
MSVGAGEAKLRDQVCLWAKRLYDRRLVHGTSGNLSVRLPDGGWLVTPTNSCLGDLDPDKLSKLDASGRLVAGDAPSKESFLHRCVYDVRSDARAIVHTHSTHSVAVSCIDGVDARNVLPPITAYHVMRVGDLPLVPYYRPGDESLALAVKELAVRHAAVLLANHGPVIAGKALDAAVHALEELEETAKIYLLLGDRRFRPLTPEQVADLHRHFPS